MRPNYNKAFNISVEVLKRYKVNKAPINILKIIDQLPNLKVCSYSNFSKQYKCSINEITDMLETVLGAIARIPRTDKFIIYHNDTKNNEGFDRFTIAHELGYYFLGHFKLITSDTLNRGGFSRAIYEALENEANCFARNLLSPVPLYKLIPQDSIDFNLKVRDTFNISLSASKARSKFLEADSYRVREDHVEYFNTYKMPYYHHCDKCKNPQITKSRYCSICGDYIREQKPLFKSTYILERTDYVIYKGIEVNDTSKAVICPICNNEKFEHGDYCSICGIFLVNECSGRNNYYHTPCNESLEGNTRFCTFCGSPSTFFINNILDSWEKERMELKISDIPF